MENYNNKKEESNILNALGQVLPIIRDILPMDAMLGVADNEKFLYYLPGKQIDVKASPGDLLLKGSGLLRCQQVGEKISQVIPKEIYGVCTKASSIPLRDKDGNIIGAFSLGLSIDTQQKLHEASETISTTTEEVNSATEELASTATELAGHLNSLKKIGKEIIGKIQNTDDILQLVKQIAKNSNLIGLNASLEAAKAKEYGLGFAVVAESIQEMSNKSAESVKEIKSILSSIQDSVSNMVEIINQTALLGDNQAAAAEEISASIDQLTGLVLNIEEISKII